MRSHEVLRAAAEQVGVKSLASELRLSPALIYKWCEQADSADPDASGTRNPLDRLPHTLNEPPGERGMTAAVALGLSIRTDDLPVLY